MTGQQQSLLGKASLLYKRCQEGDASACQQLETDNRLVSALNNQQTAPIRMAGGGSLLAPEELMPDSDSEEAKFLPLLDLLGEEQFSQLEEAMQEYPVVAEVAEMAIYTGSGDVSGMGDGDSDSVPARLSNGEFVFSKEAVDIIGLDVLEDMHNRAKAEASQMY